MTIILFQRQFLKLINIETLRSFNVQISEEVINSKLDPTKMNNNNN